MKDEKKWVCIFKTSNRFEAEAVKGNIESADIPCVMINKQDSSYLSFGYIEIHVPDSFSHTAQMLINNQIDQQ
ncbi:MAG: DUF2007 domain-containing protein [Bacteroidetes bacterium]|nr:DUF2007 domain-containing protein [Bacteroidota bacterium]MBK8330014.1 DUF2007 domain-containing protein [Bacteroidota bacterium]